MARDVGGTGFTSLSDYLNANQGTLDAGYQQDYQQAHQLGDSLNTQLGGLENAAVDMAGRSGTAPTDVPGYAAAQAQATQAQEMGNRFTSPAGTDLTPEGSFNALLEHGAHGADYASLAGYLGGLGQAPAQAVARGTQEGLGIYNTPPNLPGSPGARNNRPQGAPTSPPPPPDAPYQDPATDPNRTDPNGGPSYWWRDTGGGG